MMVKPEKRKNNIATKSDVKLEMMDRPDDFMETADTTLKVIIKYHVGQSVKILCKDKIDIPELIYIVLLVNDDGTYLVGNGVHKFTVKGEEMEAYDVK